MHRQRDGDRNGRRAYRSRLTDPSTGLKRLADAVLIAAVNDITLPHIVVCRARQIDTVFYQGPYPGIVQALQALDREQALEASPALEFTVAPLFPPLLGPEGLDDVG